MKKMHLTTVVRALLFALCAGGIARANVLNMVGTRDPATGQWTGLASLETVPVGDKGNVGELSGAGVPGGFGPNRICGAVAYDYRIGKYEVTAGQYSEFLSKVAVTDTYNLYNGYMAPYCGITRSGSSGSYAYTVAADFANRPISYVSFWDCCRFANWLQNGQPMGEQGAGTTERGAYTLDGYNGTDGRTIQRNPAATWAIASEDEWYKAAYYKEGSTNAGYWKYPTRSDTAPGQDMSDASGNNANYRTTPNVYPIDDGHYMTGVGEFQNSASPYGTFDQGGNVWEWNESVLYGSDRGTRGAAFSNIDGLEASDRDPYSYAWDELGNVGFRVVQVPEPTALALLTLGGLVIIRRRQTQPITSPHSKMAGIRRPQ